MDYSKVPNDDLLDVIEMTKKIDKFLCELFHEAESSLAMSALMNSSINCIIHQCKSFEDVLFYRSMLMHFFDSSIKNIKIKDD